MRSPIVAGLLCAIFALLSACQAPSGLSQAMADPEAAALKAERSKKWRDSYRKGTEAFAQAPSWETAPSGPSTSLALARTTYSSAQVTGNYVAMTFDDGPHPTYTPRLLDIMKARGVRGTFFVVGSRAKAHPEILRRMVREGHEVANHTWNHPDLTKLSLSSVRKEFDTTRDAIVAATGVEPQVSRPPYGAINTKLKTLIKSEYGYPTILWSVDPQDWKRPGASVVANRLVAGAAPGGILLAHDIHSPTIDAMPSTFDRLLAKGYRFVTVTELIEMELRGG